MLVAKTKTLVAGDPKDRDTFIGPMISEKEAQRLKGWIDEAVAAGATLLCGGKRDGAMLEATSARGRGPRRRGATTRKRSARSPILPKFATSTRRLREVNDSKFGLQAGIFTRDLYQMLDAWDGSRSAAS